MRKLDLRGKSYGKLTALNEVDERKDNKIQWLCECQGGKRVIVVGSLLKAGRVRSCGCLQSEVSSEAIKTVHALNVLPNGGAAFRQSMREYKGNAKRRGLSWGLTEAQFLSLVIQDCRYCGAEPRLKKTREGSSFRCNGIDRVNPEIGYEIDNCVPCCRECNSAKSDKKQNEFFEWVRAVCKHCEL